MEGPARFERAAFSVDRSVALLARQPLPSAGQASPSAGQRSPSAGTHATDGAVPLLGFRLAGPEALTDLAGLTGLSYVRVAAGELRIGSLTQHGDLIRSAVASEHFPMLREAERVFADLFTPRRGTIGGTLCQAAPTDDLAAALTAVRASMVINGPVGTRTVPARGFQPRPQETVIEPGEFLTEIRIPIRRGCGGAYEMADQGAGSCQVAGVGAVVWLAGDTVTAAGLGLTPAAAHRSGVLAAERFLAGTLATEANFARAGEIVARCPCRPADTSHDQPCQVAELISRAFRRALLRARGQDA